MESSERQFQGTSGSREGSESSFDIMKVAF